MKIEIPKVQETIDREEEEGINAEIRLDEAERAVGKLKRGKAPGTDGFYLAQNDNISIKLMRGKSSCRKHNIHSRQPPEQHKTKP